VSQRFTPTKFGNPIFDDVSAAALQTEASAFPASEYNTLLITAEMEVASAIATIEPWVLLKVKVSGVEQDIWSPLATVSMRADAVIPNASMGPLTPTYSKAAAVQVEIPNCFQVRLCLKSISSGKVKVWAGLTNRAPR
jgi:hypothetical protein